MDYLFEIVVITLLGLLVIGIPLFRVWWKTPPEDESPNPNALSQLDRDTSPDSNSHSNLTSGSFQAEDVGRFYDATTSDFVKVYGEVIQAFRTKNPETLLNYQIQAMGLKPEMVAIDAGCGVCGPACHFAAHSGASIQAVTISKVQAEKAKEKIDSRNLGDKVEVQVGDYHQLSSLFPKDHADVVYFLESFGHSHDHAAAIDSAWGVLKPGGMLYIKDLFLKEAVLPGHRPLMDREVQRINQAYRYNIADLYEVLRHLRQQGWIVGHLKTIDLPLEEFENLSISNEFQELTGIGRIDSWDDYIFPVEFFELICYKPSIGLDVGNNRYFMQNMYYMQVHGKTEAEVAKMKMNPESLISPTDA